MLNKLPPKVMETILGLVNANDYKEMALVSPRMWKIVEETPKHYQLVSCGIPVYTHNFGFSTGTKEAVETIIEFPTDLANFGNPAPVKPTLPFKLDPPMVLTTAYKDKETDVVMTSYLRMFLANSTVEMLLYPELSFEFWPSLNMKVKHVHCLGLTGYEKSQPFFDHVRPTELMCGMLFSTIAESTESIRFLSDPVICSMEKLHIDNYTGQVEWLIPVRAKDMMIGIAMLDFSISAKRQPIIDFMAHKIRKWVNGSEEIDKIQIQGNHHILSTDNFELATLFKALPYLFPSHIGWVDRTYEGMELILRASDGQALLVYFDVTSSSFYLIRCKYNFRRGRCLGSYERNCKALRTIRNLMSISTRLAEQNPKLAEDAKEKLEEECVKFNKYNNGATEMNLLVDSIWRPKRQRRSVWGSFNGNVLPTDKYPVDPSIRHAYKFTKAFETTGVLPEIDEFKPADGKEIEDWKQRFPEFAF